MHLLLSRLWKDEQGFVVSTELILLSTILVIGLLVGLVAYRDAVFQELGDTGAAIGQFNQSYTIEISEQPADGITVNQDAVIVTRDYGCIRSRTTARNFGYIDDSDVCAATDFSNLPPATMGFISPANEGQ